MLNNDKSIPKETGLEFLPQEISKVFRRFSRAGPAVRESICTGAWPQTDRVSAATTRARRRNRRWEMNLPVLGPMIRRVGLEVGGGGGG